MGLCGLAKPVEHGQGSPDGFGLEQPVGQEPLAEASDLLGSEDGSVASDAVRLAYEQADGVRAYIDRRKSHRHSIFDW
jgi:hypothetical protein